MPAPLDLDRRALALSLMASLMALASACGPGDPAPRSAAASSSEGFPRTVEAFGAPLTLAAPPRRALPSSATAYDFLADLVGPDRIVAVPFTTADYANAPFPAEARGRLAVFRNFQGEDILPWRPDLVLTHSWQREEAVRVLRQAGVPVVRLPDTRSFEDLLEALEVLGALVGEEPRAAALVRSARARRAALAADGRLAGVRALTYLDLGTGGWTAGTGTTGDLLLELAGLTNAAAEAGLAGNVEIDHERLIVIDPDLLVVRSTVAGEEASPTTDLLRASPTLSTLSALREGRVIVLPARLFAAESHYLLDAAELLHAEAVALLERG